VSWPSKRNVSTSSRTSRSVNPLPSSSCTPKNVKRLPFLKITHSCSQMVERPNNPHTLFWEKNKLKRWRNKVRCNTFFYKDIKHEKENVVILHPTPPAERKIIFAPLASFSRIDLHNRLQSARRVRTLTSPVSHPQ